MDPATTAALIGAGAGFLGGDGGDKYMSLKDRWGKHLVGDIKGLQQDYLGLSPQEYYPFQTYADLNPRQLEAYGAMGQYGRDWGTGGMVEDAQLGAGLGGADTFGLGTDYLSGMVGGGAPQFQFDMDTFDQIYNNPELPGMVDAATRDITRGLNWETLPELNTAASMGGNMASSRAGVAEGIATGMANDRAADVAADIYGNAFDQAIQGGLQAGQDNLMAGLEQDQNILQGVGSLSGLGFNQLSNAFNTGVDNLELLNLAGQGFQNQTQLGIDEDINRWNFEQQAPWDYYTDQLALLSGTLPGGGVQPNTSSGLDRALQGAQLGLGAWDAFSNIGNNQQNNSWGWGYDTSGAGGQPSWWDAGASIWG